MPDEEDSFCVYRLNTHRRKVEIANVVAVAATPSCFPWCLVVAVVACAPPPLGVAAPRPLHLFVRPEHSPTVRREDATSLSTAPEPTALLAWRDVTSRLVLGARLPDLTSLGQQSAGPNSVL